MSFKDFWLCKLQMSNLELWIYKFAVFCLSLAIGAYFADYIKPFVLPLLVVGIAGSVWITIVWLKALQVVAKK